MQIIDLDKQEILEAAQRAFLNNYIEVDTTDFFLPAIEKGEIQLDGIEHTYHVNTHYVYEDRLVKGNQTRYKVSISIITVKQNAYEVIYDSYGKCFVAIKEEELHFVPYEDFYEYIKDFIHIKEIVD